MTTEPSRADARANRQRLIEAAEAVFRERGFDAEMRDIAERAGLGMGTIYRNFPTKDDLVAAIRAAWGARIEQGIEAALRATDPVQGVRDFIRGSLEAVERYGELIEPIVVGRGPRPRTTRPPMDKLSQVTAIVQRGIEAGVFRPEVDAEVAAERLASCFVPWNFRRLRQTHTLEQLIAAHTDLFLHSVLVDGGPSGPLAQ